MQGDDEKIGALVKYNPCTTYARGDVPCPFYINGKKCEVPLGSCASAEYDRWYRELREGKTKSFFPKRMKLLDVPGKFLLLYHSHKMKIVGEAKIVKVTHQDKIHRYLFDEFTFYPNPVILSIVYSDKRLQRLSKIGRWGFVYLSAKTIGEIRSLSGLRGESQERLKRELELAKRKALEAVRLGDPWHKCEMEISKLQHVKPSVLEKTKEIAGKAITQEVRAISAKVLVYASLYLAYRTLGIPKQMYSIIKKGNIRRMKFNRAVRLLKKRLHLRFPRLKAMDWLHQYEGKLKQIVSEETLEIAAKLTREAEKDISLRTRDPLSLAAAAFHLACLQKEERIQQNSIADIFGISAVTLRNTTKHLRSLYN